MAKQLNVNLAFTADTGKAKQQLQELQRQLTQIMQSSSQKSGTLGISKEIQEATKAAASLKAHLEKATDVNTGKLDLGLLNRSFKEANTSIDKYRTNLQKLGPEGEQAFLSLANSILRAEVPLKQTSHLLTEFATTLKNTARWQISSSLLHGFMGSIQSAYYYAKDLDKSLNNIRIVTGYNTDQMAKFADEANKAAQALSTTTTAYTDAALIYYQQGLSGEAVTERVNTTIKLANVTRQAAEDVSQQMTAIWNNFDDGTKSLEHYADVITALGATTASSSAEIAEGLQKFAAVADTVGLSYDYATAALATVTATTRQSADIVGNAFKTLFSRLEGLKLGETLEDGTDLNKYSSALEAVGVSIKDTSGQLKSMDNILDELGGKWKNLAEDEKMALAQTVGGVRQYTQLIALMNNYDFFKQNVATARDSEGTLQKQADIYAESWEAAKKKVQAAAEDIYDSLLNDKFFIELNNGFANFLKLLKNVIDGIGGVQGAMTLLGSTILNIFNKDISKSINNFLYNLQDPKKIAEQQREQALTSIEKMTKDSELGTIYQNLLQPQEAYLRNAEKMSAVERKTAEFLLEQHNIRVDNLIKLKEEADEAQKIADIEKNKLNAQLSLKGSTSNQTRSINSAIDRYENTLQIGNKIRQATEKGFEIGVSKDSLKEIQLLFKNIDISKTKFSKEFQDAFKVLKSGEGTVTEVTHALGNLNTAFEQGGEAGGYDAEALELLRKVLSRVVTDEKELENILEKVTSAMDQAAGKIYNLGQAEDATSAKTENLNQILDNVQKKALSTGEKVTAVAQAFTSFSMILSTIKGLKDIWSNEDLSTGEQLVSTLGSLGMTGFMLINTLRTLGNAFGITSIKELAAVVASKALSAGYLGVASTAEAAAAGTATLGATLKFVLPMLAAIGVAITALTFVLDKVKESIKNIQDNTLEGRLKASQEAAKGLSDELNNTKNKISELSSSFDNYSKLVVAFESCKEGTTEWREALAKVNQEIVDILDKYPELAGVEGLLNKDKSGQYSINQNVAQQYLKNQTSRTEILQIATLFAQQSAKRLSSGVGAKDQRTLEIATENTNKVITNNLITSQKLGKFSDLIQTNTLGLIEQQKAKLKDLNTQELASKYGEAMGYSKTSVVKTEGNQLTLNADGKEIVTSIDQIKDIIASDRFIGSLEEIANNLGQEINKVSDNKALESWLTSGQISGISDEELENLYTKISPIEYLKEQFKVTSDEEFNQIANNLGYSSGEEFASAFSHAIIDSYQTNNLGETLWNNTFKDLESKVNFSQGEFTKFIDELNEEDKSFIISGKLQIDKYKSIEEIQKAIDEIKAEAKAADVKINLDEDVDEDKFNELRNHIKENAEEIEGLNKDIIKNGKAVAEVTEDLLRYDHALEDIQENAKNWEELLKSDNIQDQAQAVKELGNAYADLLDLDASSLSKDFITNTENLQLMKEAAEGSEEAYNKLQELAAKDILFHLGIDTERFDQDLAYIQSWIFNGNAFPDIEVGASLDITEFLNGLTDMVNSAGMTAQQATDYLSSMGIDAEVETVKTESQDTHQYTGAIAHVDTQEIQSTDPITGMPVTYRVPSITYETVPVESTDIQENTSFALKVKSATKSSGGNFKFKNTSHGAGSAGRTARAPKKGGGSKEKTPEVKEYKEDESDRYWDINNAIKAVENSFKRLEAVQKRVETRQSHYYGKALIESLKNENELIEEQNKLIAKQKKNYEALEKEQFKELGELKGALISLGGSFDKDRLTNYFGVMQQGLADYNSAVDAYNASAQEDADKKALESAEKTYSNLKDTLGKYQDLYYNKLSETKSKLEELTQEELENYYKLLENNLKAWEIEIELKLELTEAKRKWNEFLKQVEKDFRKVFQDLTIENGFGKDNFTTYAEDINTTLTAIKDVELEIDRIQAGSASDKFDNISEAQEKLKELQDQLIDQGKSLNDVYQELWDNYINGINQVNDKFDDLMKRYQRLDDELEYEKELIELIYGDEAYELMNKFYDAQQANALAQIDSLRQQAAFWENEFNKSYQMNKDRVNLDDITTWTEDMKQAYEQMNTAQQSLNDKIIEGVKLLQDKYLVTIKQITTEMDKAIWGMKLDQAKADWDFIQKRASEYLDDVEGAYRIQTLANKITKSIAEASSLTAQQKLQALRESEITMLREKEHLTQSDIDLAEARYQIALKEIALQDAQNNKTSMKLTRDTSGNWTYQYVADEEDVRNKQQELLDAYNNLYEMADQAYNHAMELAMNTYEEMQNRIREIAEDMTLSEEEKMQKIQEIYDMYLPLIDAAFENSELYKQEAMTATGAIFLEIVEQDKEAFQSLTDLQKELLDQIRDKHLEDYEAIRSAIVDEVYPAIRESAQQTFEQFNENSKTQVENTKNNWIQNPDSIKNTVEQAYKDITAAGEAYRISLEDLQNKAGQYFNKIGQSIDSVRSKTEQLDDKTRQLTNDSATYLDILRQYVDSVAMSWVNVIGMIQQAKAELEAYLALQTAIVREQFREEESDTPATGAGGGQGGLGSGAGSTAGSGGKSAPKTGQTGSYNISGYDPRGYAMNQDYLESLSSYDIARLRNAGYRINTFATGGYTGSWDDTGRLAVLHQKELVLNADDTANMLQAVSAVRDLAKLNDSINSAIASSIGAMAMNIVANSGNGINPVNNSNTDNQYYITAEFPNANDVNSIREAILSLPNLASQWIHSNN